MARSAYPARKWFTDVGDTLLAVAVGVTVAALVGFSLLLCAGILLFSAFEREGTGYGPTGTAAFISELSQYASGRLGASSTLAVALAAAAVFAVIGARVRSGVAMWVGIVCGGMYALTLVLLATDAAASIDHLTERALDSARGDVPPAPIATPTPSGPPPLGIDTAYDETRRMVDLTLDAAESAAADAQGLPVVGDLPLNASACEENGTRFAVSFAVAGSAGASARALDAWSREGYSADRAMQQDIRYSVDRPVETLRVHDTTTIDGLVHFAIESRCAVDR